MYNVENNLCYCENYFNVPYDNSTHIIKAVKIRLINWPWYMLTCGSSLAKMIAILYVVPK